MISRNIKFLIAALILLSAAGGGLYFLATLNSPTADAPAADKDQKNEPPPFTLDRPIAITANLSLKDAVEAKKVLNQTIKSLKQYPDVYEDWIQLGLYRKLIGDYEGAREAWEYAAKIRPTIGVAFHNLGNLYASELKDIEKAEQYYLKAIENEPVHIQWYVAAYEYYRFLAHDNAKARAILRKGIEINPDQQAVLAQMLATF